MESGVIEERGTLAMWAEALKGMPRLDAQGWRRLDPVARWLIATRAAVLVMTSSRRPLPASSPSARGPSIHCVGV